MSAPDAVVGIDLGTTFSAVAWFNELGEVEMVPNAESENITPSVVLVDGDRFVVGKEAWAQAVVRPDDVAQCIKRMMGEDFRFLGKYLPEEISAKILQKIVSDASASLNRPIRRAVITVPAYFVEPQLIATKKAGELAGLEVLALLPEPEAAAIHFGVRRLEDKESVLVCDLGGGTYDASILKMEGQSLKAVKTRGSRKLGGHDWTMALAEMAAEKIEDATGIDPKTDLAVWQLLCDRAEEKKKMLSTLEQVEFEWNHEGRPLQIHVTRAEFESRTQPLLDEVLNKTSEAVTDAGLTFADITHVLLVGGSSRLPKFASEIERIAGKKPKKTQNPDEAIARGAALVARGFAEGHADRKTGKITVISGTGSSRRIMILQRRTSHALGTMTYEHSSTGIVYHREPIIPENADIPTTADRKGLKIVRGQETFQVPVLQLDSHGNQQEILGNYRFNAVPVPTGDVAVTVRFEYDADGIAKVSAFEESTGREYQGRREPFVPPSDQPPITEPGTVVLCVDCSGSMGGSKIVEAKSLFVNLAEKYAKLGRNWSVAVVNFGGDYKIYPATVLLRPTQDVDQIRRIESQLTVGGGTPMDAGLLKIRELLETAPGKRLAIVLTDGAPNNRTSSEQIAQTLKSLKITIATVPIGADADKEFLRRIGDLESTVTVDSSGGGMTDAVIDLLQRV